MRKDKKEALQLRSLGKSYSEIKNILGVPKSTLSDWLRKTQWSKKIKRILAEKAQEKNTIRLRNLNKIRGEHLARLYREARNEAREEFEYFKLYPTFISGIALYWGEGDKLSRHLIRIGNIDPLMIRIFVEFLCEVCGIPKKAIRAYVLLYPDLDPNKCKDFWIKKSGLSAENFNKCVVIRGRHKTRRIPYGVCYVSVSSTYLKEKMRIWLTLLPKELVKKSYYLRV
jgi:predicted transcriptional regulator